MQFKPINDNTFCTLWKVITSKQRPRKLIIRGSNGKDYMFLLKGHEDLRQDERVMQLFGLVNTLLQKDPDTFRRNLTIQRYVVIPLSTKSGLIGWVPHCDTLHTLIRDYRDKKKILLNIEHRIMLRMAPDYDHLTVMQKVKWLFWIYPVDFHLKFAFFFVWKNVRTLDFQSLFFNSFKSQVHLPYIILTWYFC